MTIGGRRKFKADAELVQTVFKAEQTMRSDIVVEPISARMTPKCPAIFAAQALAAGFVSAFASSVFSAIAEITAIRCDLPVP